MLEVCADKEELKKALKELKEGSNEKFNIRQIQPAGLEARFRKIFKANLILFKTLLRWTRS